MISKRPASISNIKTNFDNTEKSAKLPAGPTMLSPGPMLLRVAKMEVKFVAKSKPSREISKKEAK